MISQVIITVIFIALCCGYYWSTQASSHDKFEAEGKGYVYNFFRAHGYLPENKEFPVGVKDSYIAFFMKGFYEACKELSKQENKAKKRKRITLSKLIGLLEDEDALIEIVDESRDDEQHYKMWLDEVRRGKYEYLKTRMVRSYSFMNDKSENIDITIYLD